MKMIAPRELVQPGMDISLVVAVSRTGVIGCNGALPWHIPTDLKRFRNLTTGNVLLMGRKTFDSIGKPLPNRHSIVLSLTKPDSSLRLFSDQERLDESVVFAASLTQAFEIARKKISLLPRTRGETNELFVIGGGIVFAETFPYANRLYVTTVDAAVTGDSHFPEILPQEWAITDQDQGFQRGPRDEYAHRFQIFERISDLSNRVELNEHLTY